MKPKLLVTLLSLALGACAVSPENKLAWETRPVMDIRHGMANAMAYYQLGRHHQEQGQLAAAEAAYDQALVADPKSVDALNALGAIYAGRGELERAAAAYRTVARLAPQRAYLYNNIGYALYLQGRHAEAVDALRQAVAMDPDYARAWVNLQNVARKAGMFELAALAARRSPDLLLPKLAVANPAAVDDVPVSRKIDEQLSAIPAEPAVPRVLADASPQAVVAEPEQRNPSIIAKRPLPIRLSDASPLGAASARAVTLTETPVPAASRHALASPVVRAMKVLMHPSLPVFRQAPAMPARVEVSNGNGVTGYAALVRTQLRSEGFGVTRMTNFRSFNIPYSIIEYRSGFADAARALKDSLGRNALLRETEVERAGTDVRLIIGRDWGAPRRILSGIENEIFPPA
ncbi:MAG: tetratricopeptide repeat protein [Bacteroidota bacterium]